MSVDGTTYSGEENEAVSKQRMAIQKICGSKENGNRDRQRV